MSLAKKYYLMRVIVSVLFGVALGVFFLLLAPFGRELFDILVIAIGIFTVLINLPPLFISLRHIKRRGEWIALVISLASAVLGVLFVFLTDDFLPWLFLFYSLLLPIVRVLLVQSRGRQIRHELAHLVIGVFMMLVYYSDAESYVLRYGGIAAFVIAGIYLIVGILSLRFVENRD